MTTDLSKNSEHLRSIHFKLVALCLILLAALSFKDKEIENSIKELEKIKEITERENRTNISNNLYYTDEDILSLYTDKISNKIFKLNEIYLLEFFQEDNKDKNSFYKVYISFYQRPIKIPMIKDGVLIGSQEYMQRYDFNFKKVKDFKNYWNGLDFLNHIYIPKINESLYKSEYNIYKSSEFDTKHKVAEFYTKITKIPMNTKTPKTDIHLVKLEPSDILGPRWYLESKNKNPNKVLYITREYLFKHSQIDRDILDYISLSKQELIDINFRNWLKLSDIFIETFSNEIHKADLIETNSKINNKIQLMNLDIFDEIKIYTSYFDILWNPRDIYKDDYPEKNKLQFENAFETLDELIQEFPDISIDDAITLLNRDKKLLGEKFEVFGVKFSSDTLSVWGVLLLLGIQLYFLLHLYDFVKKNTNSNDSWNIAWIANYNNIYSKSTTIISACIIPVYVVITLRYLEVEDFNTVDKNLYILIFLSLISISLAGLTGKSFIKMWKQISE